MNDLANLDLLAMLAREHQEEMLCEAKTRMMLKELNSQLRPQPRPQLRPTLFLLALVAVTAAAWIGWAML